jgi:hypothetical protein
MYPYKKISKHLGCCWWFGGMIPTLAGAFGSTPLYNDATGGTETNFSIDGKNYKRHTFTGSGSKTFTVIRSPNLFTVMLLGAGGGGSAGYIAAIGVGGSGGGGGGAFEGQLAIPVGNNIGTVGTGGAGGSYPAGAGVNGTSTSFLSKTAGGGGRGGTEYGGSPGSGSTGDGPTGSGGYGGYSTQTPGGSYGPSFPGQTLRNSYSLGNSGNGGGGGGQDGGSGGSGISGAIAITYEIG